MRIFVGNFAFTTTKDELRQLFEAYGNVEQVVISMKSEQVLGPRVSNQREE